MADEREVCEMQPQHSGRYLKPAEEETSELGWRRFREGKREGQR